MQQRAFFRSDYDEVKLYSSFKIEYTMATIMTKLRIFTLVLITLLSMVSPFLKLQQLWAKPNSARFAQNTVLQSDAIQAAVNMLLEEDEEGQTVFLPLISK